MDAVLARLSGLSLTPSVLTHAASPTPAEWSVSLAGSPEATLTKTLVFKPKTAKKDTVVPVVVVCVDSAVTSSGALGKKLGLKEMRLASEDLLAEFFQGVAKDEGEYGCALQ